MDDLIIKLKNWGCDTKLALERMCNDMELYKELLLECHKLKGFEDFYKAVENANWELAFKEAHSLKGVLGNLGLDPLYKAVCNVVDMLRKGVEPDESFWPKLEEVKIQEQTFISIISSLE